MIDKLKSVLTATAIGMVLLNSLRSVPRHTSPCAEINSREIWQAYHKLQRKVLRSNLRIKPAIIPWSLLSVAWIIAVYTTNYKPPVPGIIGTIELIVIGLIGAALVEIIATPVIDVVLSMVIMDKIGWADIKNCFDYIAQDPILATGCALSTVRELAESSIAALWGGVTILGVLFGLIITILLSDVTRNLGTVPQVIITVVACIFGLSSLFQAVLANSNTLIARAIMFWQKDPQEAKKAVTRNTSERTSSPFRKRQI